jgi:cell division protein FtsL
MAELFLDIRDRHIRAIASENELILFQKSYPLSSTTKEDGYDRQNQPSDGASDLLAGELADTLSLIRTDSGIHLSHAHLILPTADVKFSTHVLQRMPQQDALKLLSRKTATGPEEESPQINLCPMSFEQNNQTWLVECIATEKLKEYKKELSNSNLKLKTVVTALDATLHAVASIRDSIFNAHAVFEINTHTIEAYYLSSSCLLFHETLEISESSDSNNESDPERKQKRRMFAILDLLYRVNTQYTNSNPINPLQKVWLCGTNASVPELVEVLQDAMDVEISLLPAGKADNEESEHQYTVLKGLLKAHYEGELFNYLHPDMLRRFPLRKKSGMLIYIATILLAVSIIIMTEYRHNKLHRQAVAEKKNLAAQKSSQSASITFAKNLDLLRKLSGSQVLFYPIFRELAMTLPEGVFLDSFNYSLKNNLDSIEMSATFIQSSDLGTQKTLTKLTEILDRSPYLLHHLEPSVSSGTKGHNKTMTVKFSCEVNPLDTAK